MRTPSLSTEQWVLGGAVVLVVGYIALRGVKGAAKDAAGAVVSAGAGAIEGTVVAGGQIFGIPATDEQLCELACTNGDTGKASVYCSAGRFASYLWNGK